jgi:hypothetical protein
MGSMEADFVSRERHGTDLNRFRWVHDRMDECWFALFQSALSIGHRGVKCPPCHSKPKINNTGFGVANCFLNARARRAPDLTARPRCSEYLLNLVLFQPGTHRQLCVHTAVAVPLYMHQKQ